jgi:hypothetical protein
MNERVMSQLGQNATWWAFRAESGLSPMPDIFAGRIKGSGHGRLLIAFELSQQEVRDISWHWDPPDDVRPKVDRWRTYQLLRQSYDMKIVVKMVRLPAIVDLDRTRGLHSR